MKHIIAIVGDAGTGKDTIARWLADHNGWELVVSYTTRPMREGEENGREHIFVTDCPYTASSSKPDGTPSITGRDGVGLLLAYTQYGGYEYWTTWSQISSDHPTLYVIDEHGLLTLLEARAEGKTQLTTIHVTADEAVRLKRGVSPERMERDKTRENPLTYFKYDYEIKNNKSMKALEHVLRGIIPD